MLLLTHALPHLQGVNAITPEEASEHSLFIKRWPCSTSSTASSGASPATAGDLPLQQLSLGGSQLPTAEPASQAAQAGAQSAVPGRPDGSSSSTAAGSSAGEQGGERGASKGAPGMGRSEVGSGRDGDGSKGDFSVLPAQPLPVLKLPAADNASGVVSVSIWLSTRFEPVSESHGPSYQPHRVPCSCLQVDMLQP